MRLATRSSRNLGCRKQSAASGRFWPAAGTQTTLANDSLPDKSSQPASGHSGLEAFQRLPQVLAETEAGLAEQLPDVARRRVLLIGEALQREFAVVELGLDGLADSALPSK